MLWVTFTKGRVMDFLLILIAIIIGVVIIGMNVIVMITYASDEDKNQAWMAHPGLPGLGWSGVSLSPLHLRSISPYILS